MSEKKSHHQKSSDDSSVVMQDQSGLCVISVPSSWQSSKSGRSVTCQTSGQMTMETGVQTQSATTAEDENSRIAVASGTDDRGGAPPAENAGSGWVYPGDHYDEQEVAEFLNDCYQPLTSELKQMTKSSAFDGYEPGWKDKSSVGAKLVATFPSVVYLDHPSAAAKDTGSSPMFSSPTSTAAGAFGSQQQQNSPQHQQQQTNVQALQVTGVSWNAAGALVGASYGRVDSYTWSTGNGFIAIWPAAGSHSHSKNEEEKENANEGGSGGSKKSSSKKSKAEKSSTSSPLKKDSKNSSNSNAPERPLILLETDAFATCVAFHPVIPTLVAAATFSGEILLWDISSTDDASASSVKPLCSNFGGFDKHHDRRSAAASAASSNQESSSSSSTGSKSQDPINKLIWIQNPREPRESHKYLICSGASDGTVSFWTPSNKFSEPVGQGKLFNRRRASLGVQSICFTSTAGLGRKTPAQDAPMIIGTDSGDVVKGKVPARATTSINTTSASSKTASGNSKGAVVTASLNDTEFFETHSGPANSVDASPFFRNIFLSCSSDGSIRLYSLLDMSHKLALVPSPDTKHFLYGAAFSPIRPGVIATCSRSSQVHLYDLTHSRVKPSCTLDRAGTEDSAVLCLGWSSHGSSFATGDAKGCVRVWSVAPALCETTELERLAIRSADKAVSSASGMDNSPSRASFRGGANDPLTQSALEGGKLHDVGAGADPVQLLYGFTV